MPTQQCPAALDDGKGGGDCVQDRARGHEYVPRRHVGRRHSYGLLLAGRESRVVVHACRGRRLVGLSVNRMKELACDVWQLAPCLLGTDALFKRRGRQWTADEYKWEDAEVVKLWDNVVV